MNESLEQQMRRLKLSGMAKGWRDVEFHDVEQYVGALLELELHEREVNRINRIKISTQNPQNLRNRSTPRISSSDCVFF